MIFFSKNKFYYLKNIFYIWNRYIWMFTNEEWKREVVYAVVHKGKKNPIEKQYFHWMGIFLLKRIETGQKESKLQIPIQVAPLARD